MRTFRETIFRSNKEIPVKVTSDIEKLIIEYCKSKLPNEACGYLIRTRDNSVSFAEMNNMANSPKLFLFDPREQFELVRRLRAKGESIIGVFHSHPMGRAYPSEKDIEFADPHYIQMIIVPESEEIGYFRISDGVVKIRAL